MRLILLISSLSFTLLSSSTSAQGTQPASGQLTIDALIDVKHPSNPVWSPDGRRVAFVWNRAGVENVWLVDLSGSKPALPRALTRFDSSDASGLFWSADGRKIWFTREGHLWTVDVDASTEAFPLWSTRHENAPEYAGAKILYTWIERGFGDVAIVGLDSGLTVTVMPNPEFRESGVRWADGSRVVFER